MPEFLRDYREEYQQISVHRNVGFGIEPLLPTLDMFDRKLGIDREPFETEILMTLDMLQRVRAAQSKPTEPQAQNRGNRR